MGDCICQHHTKTKESEYCVPGDLSSLASLDMPDSLNSPHWWVCPEYHPGIPSFHRYIAMEGLGSLEWRGSSFILNVVAECERAKAIQEPYETSPVKMGPSHGFQSGAPWNT